MTNPQENPQAPTTDVPPVPPVPPSKEKGWRFSRKNTEPQTTPTDGPSTEEALKDTGEALKKDARKFRNAVRVKARKVWDENKQIRKQTNQTLRRSLSNAPTWRRLTRDDLLRRVAQQDEAVTKARMASVEKPNDFILQEEVHLAEINKLRAQAKLADYDERHPFAAATQAQDPLATPDQKTDTRSASRARHRSPLRDRGRKVAEQSRRARTDREKALREKSKDLPGVGVPRSIRHFRLVVAERTALVVDFLHIGVSAVFEGITTFAAWAPSWLLNGISSVISWVWINLWKGVHWMVQLIVDVVFTIIAAVLVSIMVVVTTLVNVIISPVVTLYRRFTRESGQAPGVQPAPAAAV